MTGQSESGTDHSTCLKCEERAEGSVSTCPTCGSGQMVQGDGSVEHDWSDHWPTDPKLTSGLRDQFTLRVNQTQLLFRSREHFPMLVEIYVGSEERPIGAINTARGETVSLGGVDEMLADRVDEIRDMPVEEIPDALEKLAYRLNPSGREDPETTDKESTDTDQEGGDE